MDFGRLMTAMATPFDDDGQIDERALERLIDHLICTGTTTIIVNGTTAESPTLSHEEKIRIIEKTVKHVSGRIPVIAGTGGNNTADTIEFSKEVESLGVNGLLLVSPYYNKPTQDGLYAHFTEVARAVKLPIVLYNIPGRTAVTIEVETLMRLAAEPNIIGVKESSGDFNLITNLSSVKPDDFFVWCGDDKFTLPMMAVGAYGVVSVASHVVGPEMSKMIEAFTQGNIQQAIRWQNRLVPAFNALFRVSSPSPLKAALSMLELSTPVVRLPLVKAPDHVVKEVRQVLETFAKI